MLQGATARRGRSTREGGGAEKAIGQSGINWTELGYYIRAYKARLISSGLSTNVRQVLKLKKSWS